MVIFVTISVAKLVVHQNAFKTVPPLGPFMPFLVLQVNMQLPLFQASGSVLIDSWKTLNSASAAKKPGDAGTIKRAKGGGKESVTSLGGGGGREAAPPNARKMYEEAQMVRRVKAYINKMPVIFDDDELQRMAAKCEVIL